MRAVTAGQEAIFMLKEIPDKRKKNLKISDAERLWNSNFGKSANLNWTKPWASCPTLESALFQAGGWTGDLQGSTLLLLWFNDYKIRQGSNVAPHEACFTPIALEYPTYKNISVPQPPPCWQRFILLNEHGETLPPLRDTFVQKHAGMNSSNK